MYIREKRIYLDGEDLLPEDIARIDQVIGGVITLSMSLRSSRRAEPNPIQGSCTKDAGGNKMFLL